MKLTDYTYLLIGYVYFDRLCILRQIMHSHRANMHSPLTWGVTDKNLLVPCEATLQTNLHEVLIWPFIRVSLQPLYFIVEWKRAQLNATVPRVLTPSLIDYWYESTKVRGHYIF